METQKVKQISESCCYRHLNKLPHDERRGEEKQKIKTEKILLSDLNLNQRVANKTHSTAARERKNVLYLNVIPAFESAASETNTTTKQKGNRKKTREVIKKKAAIILLSCSPTCIYIVLTFCGFYNMKSNVRNIWKY